LLRRFSSVFLRFGGRGMKYKMCAEYIKVCAILVVGVHGNPRAVERSVNPKTGVAQGATARYPPVLALPPAAVQMNLECLAEAEVDVAKAVGRCPQTGGGAGTLHSHFFSFGKLLGTAVMLRFRRQFSLWSHSQTNSCPTHPKPVVYRFFIGFFPLHKSSNHVPQPFEEILRLFFCDPWV